MVPTPTTATRNGAVTGVAELADHDHDVAGADGLTRLDLDLLDLAGGLGVDLVLHLHGLEDAHRLTGFHLVTDSDEHLDDGPLHRDGHAAASGPSTSSSSRRL